MKDLREKLAHGDVQRIADLTGYSRTHVDRILSGRYATFNDIIINAAKEIINGRAKLKKQIEKL